MVPSLVSGQVLTETWPNQDISNALFLAALAYIAGLMLQNVAEKVVPATASDCAKRKRFPSDLILDHSDSRFGKDFKERLSKQVKVLFGLDIEVS